MNDLVFETESDAADDPMVGGYGPRVQHDSGNSSLTLAGCGAMPVVAVHGHEAGAAGSGRQKVGRCWRHGVSIRSHAANATYLGRGESSVMRQGRLIAVGLMIVGIGFIGVLTATITSVFLEHGRPTEADELRERLERIEAKLDALSRR
jgi:hypothetical protein